MTRTNTTFGRGSPTWANACVGNNGLPGYWEYAKGFSQAANLILDTILQDQGLNHSVDELVYPVCFSMRHSVELCLKAAVSELVSLEQCRGRSIQSDLEGSHDIENIWRFFAKNSASIDDRYTPINMRLGPKIVDIAEIDATGQTFRYPLDRESQKHLVDVAIINFVKLKRSFAELEETINELHILNRYLREEYRFGTFTKHLSRRNIFEIASELPSRSQWKEESFTAIRNNIKKRFKIGSKELSESIKIIEKHFEFSPMIGMSMDLLGVSNNDIEKFAQLWFNLHDLSSDFDPIETKIMERRFEASFSLLVRNIAAQQEAWKEMRSNLTPEVLAGISALFYFGHDLDFSERYARIYEHHLREAEVAFERPENEARSQFLHILHKTNGIHNILRSLYFLKKGGLAEVLVSAHCLDSKFSWLDQARSWVLFEKQNYCGYTIY